MDSIVIGIILDYLMTQTECGPSCRKSLMATLFLVFLNSSRLMLLPSKLLPAKYLLPPHFILSLIFTIASLSLFFLHHTLNRRAQAAVCKIETP
jgi:hypothetical protein